MPSLAEKVTQLRANIERLQSAGDREFAASLCSYFERRDTLSSRQIYWLDRLLATAETQPAATAAVPETRPVGNLTNLLALFDRAQAHLQHPAIVLNSTVGQVRISRAGSTARVPGSLNVTSVDPTYGNRRAWYGRVTTDGNFTPARDYQHGDVITARLVELAADPARVAGEQGRLTGVCCFCRRPLEDERSTPWLAHGAGSF